MFTGEEAFAVALQIKSGIAIGVGIGPQAVCTEEETLAIKSRANLVL